MTDAAPFIAALEGAGFRLTEPRRAVARLIADQPGHFTSADLVADARSRRLGIGRATIFRTLEVLSELGVVERLDLPSGEHAYVGCAPEPPPPRRLLQLRADRRDPGRRSPDGRPRGLATDGVPRRRAPARTVRPVPRLPGRGADADPANRLTSRRTNAHDDRRLAAER